MSEGIKRIEEGILQRIEEEIQEGIKGIQEGIQEGIKGIQEGIKRIEKGIQEGIQEGIKRIEEEVLKREPITLYCGEGGSLTKTALLIGNTPTA
jgi:phage-related protein